MREGVLYGDASLRRHAWPTGDRGRPQIARLPTAATSGTSLNRHAPADTTVRLFVCGRAPRGAAAGGGPQTFGTPRLGSRC
ncbi:hypothetical protein EVAR_31505_1 [Eumeta japonica]|uniref:Uncharacterized protein n=1 Tax=Eumeta variegata TaxID=151549 RepID=A0A4C1Z1W2_EUMVA|nr:hypothetical protein EVAR_31505_1 [Eumeta japonica]